MTQVAQFEIHYTQILNEEGILCAQLPEFAQDPMQLTTLYKTMVLARTFDKKAIALQRTGKMGTYAPINGQEAISTAIGHAMHKEDVLVPYYRDYAAQLQRGVKMSEILSYWGGDERGSCFQNCPEDLPICVPIASQCLHAAGIAFAFQYRKEPRVAVVCLGDGGTSEGDFYEALNVAGIWNLPVVFIVNNNQWAISVPLSAQSACQTLAQKAVAGGFEGRQVDGNDVIACREVIGYAIEKARQGQGPTLVEAKTYRLCDHTTADDATRYQNEKDVFEATGKEPIVRMKKFLIGQNLWSEEKEAQLQETVSMQVQQAVDEYETNLQNQQTLDSIFDYHYSQMPEYLMAQKAQALEEGNHG